MDTIIFFHAVSPMFYNAMGAIGCHNQFWILHLHLQEALPIKWVLICDPCYTKVFYFILYLYFVS